MSTNKPPPPPGLPNIAQRVAALQLAARRSHDDSSPSPRLRSSRGPYTTSRHSNSNVLFRRDSSYLKHNKAKIPMLVTFPTPVVVEDDHDDHHHGDFLEDHDHDDASCPRCSSTTRLGSSSTCSSKPSPSSVVVKRKPSRRPRFLRFKNKDKYTRVDSVDKARDQDVLVTEEDAKEEM